MTKYTQLKIEVTDKVIAEATERDSSHCMIAEAIRANLPDVSHISVDLQTIRFTNRRTRKRYVYLTPRPGQVQLVNFDQGIKPEPFTLLLARPQVVDISDSRSQRRALAGRDDIRPDAIIEDKRPTKKSRAAEIKGVPTATHEGGRPYKTGGKTPPTAALTNRGRIREFGLKASVK